MFNEFFKEMDVSITPKKANIARKWIFDGHVNRTQMDTDRGPVTTDQEEEKTTVQGQVPNQDLTRIGGKPNPNDQGQEEPKVSVSSDLVPASTDPARNAQVKLPGNTTMEDIIQILDDHIALSENTEKPPSETDPLEELLALEQEEQESESELEEEGIVNVVDTSESDNDEVTVNPTEMEADPEIGEHMGDNTPQENNNNQDEQKTTLQMPTSWRNITRTPSQQLLLHRVPITFPVPGNLLESEDSLRFIIEALGSLVESNGFLINLPMGANVDATPLHRVMSYQARSVVILTFDTTETRDRVWKAARAVKPSTNFSGRTEYYFTEIAKRTKMRRENRTEDEHQGMGNDTENTQEEKRTMKLKKRSKEKSQAVKLATKMKNKYSALDEYAEKRKKKGGYSYGNTSERLRLMSDEGRVRGNCHHTDRWTVRC